MEDTVTNNKPKAMIRPQTSKYDKDIQQNFNNNNISNKMIETRKDKNIFQNFDRNNEIINEEMEPIEPLYQQKENLKNINLIEKDINSLYKWEHLFNNFRPISCYTTIQNEPKKNENDKEVTKNKNLDFKSPILLVDLPESQMNLFFGMNNIYESSSRNKKSKSTKKLKKKEKLRNSSHSNNTLQNNKNIKNNTNISHNIRPMSMYSPRMENSCYYFSSTFSDYYNEDFKSFCNKMPILKAKLKINSGKLKKEIESHDKESNKKEQLLQKISSKERIYLDKQDLIIAAKRRNPIPLLKSIFKQNYPGLEVAKENPKLYFNTMKPYGNDYGDVDYQQNDRWKLSNEIIKMRMLNAKLKNEDFKIENFNHYGSKKQHKNRLLLSYYNASDPAIVKFNKKIESIKRNVENEHIFINNENVKKETDAITELEEDKEKEINDSNINSSIKMRNETSKENTSTKNGKENNKIIIDAKKREKYKEEIISDRTKSIKPKLSLKKEIKRPKTINKNLNINISQTLNNLGIKDENLYSDYTSSNCFPLKTSSDVGNTSYNKINKFIREKKLINNLDLLLSSQSKASSRKSMPNKLNRHPVNMEMYDKNLDLQLIIASKKIKPKKSFSLYKAATTDDKSHNSRKIYKKWDKGGNLISDKKSKVNYYCFNNYIETVFNKDLINFKKNEDNQYFFPMNAYNKLAGKYYHCDLEEYNNNNSKQLNNIDYSRDEDNDNELTSRKKQNKENEDIYNQLKNNSSILKDN